MSIESQFKEAVKRHIGLFNAERGRRKELAPQLVVRGPGLWQRYGRVIAFGEDRPLAMDAIDRMAKATIRTLLRRNPRPIKMALDVFQEWNNEFHPGRYLFRLMLQVKGSVKL